MCTHRHTLDDGTMAEREQQQQRGSNREAAQYVDAAVKAASGVVREICNDVNAHDARVWLNPHDDGYAFCVCCVYVFRKAAVNGRRAVVEVGIAYRSVVCGFLMGVRV